MKNYLQRFEIQKPNLEKRKLSYSSLKQFARSPIHYIQYLNEKFEPTDSMVLGSVVDCLLLTPDEFENKYLVIPKIDRRSKAGKEAYAEAQSRAAENNLTIVSEVQYNTAQIMVDQVSNNPEAKAILNGTTETQKKIEWKHKELPFVGYLDGAGEFHDGKKFIFDLKTTSDASLDAYTKQLINLKYDLQIAMYYIAYQRQHFQQPLAYHIVVENKAPYSCNVFKLSDTVLEAGKRVYDSLCDKFKECMEDENWGAGYEFFQQPNQILELPEWYINKLV